MSISQRIGVIGAGKIGEALIQGMLAANALPHERLCAGECREDRCEYVSKKYGIRCYVDNRDVASNADVLIIAVRPNDVKTVLEDIGETVTSKQLIITLAAGVSTAYVAKHLGSKAPIVRAMPNTPCLIGEGMTAVTQGPNASDEHVTVAQNIFSTLGKVVKVDEKHMDAITGLSGSGPAYIYVVIEALAEAGVKVGLPRELATTLVAQTTLGSARMVMETNEHPAKLRDMVTTPGGVTIDGILQLEEGKLRMTLINAVVKATERSRELLMN